MLCCDALFNASTKQPRTLFIAVNLKYNSKTCLTAIFSLRWRNSPHTILLPYFTNKVREVSVRTNI